jgi:hypothetical protein
VAALAAGHTVTATGFAIGVEGSGRLSAVSWVQAERGVLLTGGDPVELDQIGLAITCAAVRRRKAVLVLDLTAAEARRGHVSCGQDHLSWGQDHVSWHRDDLSRGREALMPVMPRSVVGGRMKRSRPARLDRCGASVCARVAALAERVGVPVACIGAVGDPAPGVIGAAAVPGAKDSEPRWLSGAFGRAIRGRSIVLLPARNAVAAQSEAARQALGELVGALTSLRELGLRGDCLAWVVGCEAADASRLSDLLSLGHATGTAVVLSATDPEVTAGLAAEAGVVVASGPITGDLAQRLANLAVGNTAIAPAPGHGLPIDALLRASIDDSRPPAPESVAGSATVRQAFADLLRGQRRGSATMIAGGTISGCRSLVTVPIDVTEFR